MIVYIFSDIDLNSTELVSSTSGNETEPTSASIFVNPTSTEIVSSTFGNETEPTSASIFDNPTSTEIVSSTSGNEIEPTSPSNFDNPTSADSKDNDKPEISLEDLLKKLNITKDLKMDPDEVEGFLQYLPYIILTVVVLGLVYVVKMFLDFMKFCAKFYNKLPKFASKEVQTSDTKNTTPKEMETNL